MIKYVITILTAISLISCKNKVEESKQEQSVKFKVEYHGALKNIMHKGDVTAKAKLSDLKDIEHLYALGALENLKGEIQIFNSSPFNTMVTDSTLTFDNTLTKKATLVVYVSVSKWYSLNIPNDVVTYDQLESYIEQSAQENHINIKEPFPFLIEGTANSIDWHVINWKDGDTEHSHEKHINSGLNGTANNRDVKMLGFYSNSHHAIFTHHTTNMHIHVKTNDNKIAGHVDGLTLGKGMILKLPNNN
jgi:acetolactate decarboxylase